MKELLEFIIKSLVSQPQAVEIEGEEKNGVINLNLKVAKEDMGMVIGRQGKVIKAIRTLLKARGLTEKKKVQLILEESESKESKK